MRGKQSCQIYVVRYYSQTDLLASLLILYDAVKAVCATCQPHLQLRGERQSLNWLSLYTTFKRPINFG